MNRERQAHTHTWQVPKNLTTASYYFHIAANLGDPDAQNDLAFCYAHGHGVKKDPYKAAMYYRKAERQGHGIVGNSWIWKDKYSIVDDDNWDGLSHHQQHQHTRVLILASFINL